jgi:hypothetical protein
MAATIAYLVGSQLAQNQELQMALKVSPGFTSFSIHYSPFSINTLLRTYLQENYKK